MTDMNSDAEDLLMALGFVEACEKKDEQNVDLLSQMFRQLPDGETRLANSLLTLSASLAERFRDETGRSPYDDIRQSIMRQLNEG